MKTKYCISAFLASLSVLCICGCRAEPEVSRRDPDEIVSEIVCSYGKDSGSENTRALLKELQETDSASGDLWNGIMEYWAYANMEMPHSQQKLPDSLPDDNTLCIVVLGYQLNPDGTMQDELVGRLETARTCAEQYPAAQVLCTGGGTASFAPDITEADQMADWLIMHGISANRILVENRSLTTAENAEYSLRILREEVPQTESIALVTSAYHIPWGALSFEAEARLNAAEQGTKAIHVDACCAYEIQREGYGEYENRLCQTNSLLYLLQVHGNKYV